MSKCSFFQREIRYLVNIINKEGLKKDPTKVEVILSTPIPKYIHWVRAFADMINYYGRFVKNVSGLMESIYT